MPTVPNSYPSTDNLPHGVDRADGLGGRLGTPTPADAISYDSPDGGLTVDQIPIQELSTSPTMERAEQCTIRKSFTGSWTEMLNRWAVYPRGTLVADSGNNFYRILNTNLSRIQGKGEVGQLDLTMEALSFDSPPDEFSINTVNLGLDILKNPRYFYNLIPTSQLPQPIPSYLSADSPVQTAVKSTIIRAIQAYRENPLVPPQQMFNNVSGFYHDLIVSNLQSGALNYAIPNPNFNPAYKSTAVDPTILTSPPAAATADGQPNAPLYYVSWSPSDPDPDNKISIALAAAQELVAKIWKQEDTPPVYGLEMTISEYFWRPPPINLGSYIEDPLLIVPSYFTCPSSIPDGSTIFDNIGDLNPQYYSSTGRYGGDVSISWLRQADSLEFGRTFFKRTAKWLGAPVGCWDADLFNRSNRPSSAGDYKTLAFA